MPRVMVGMLVVQTIGKIRRLQENERLPIKGICRRLGVSRKVVRKVLRSGATEFRYETREQPQPKLGAWRGELDRLLEENAGRTSRERLTLVRVFEELRGLGYAVATTRCGDMRAAGSVRVRRDGDRGDLSRRARDAEPD